MASLPTHAADASDVLDLARALEAARAAVMVENVPERSAEIFDQDLRYIHSSGSIDTREELLEKYRAKYYVYLTSVLDVAEALALSPDLLWLRGNLRLEVLSGGQERTVVAVYGAIWKRRGETWRLAVHQSTGLPKT